MGVASAASPAVAGTFSINIMRSPLDTDWRTPVSLLSAACLEMPGSAAVAIEMPNSPIGMYMSLNA